MPRDIDQIIERLRAELPGVEITQLKVKHPGADGNVWLIKIPGRDKEIQIESPDGSCPFVILGDDRIYGRSVDEVVQRVRGIHAREILKREFLQCEEEAAKGAFLLQLHCKCEWDWVAFRRLTSAMYDVAEEIKGQPSIEKWIAEGFWFCESEINAIASHSNYSRFPEDAYRDGVGLIHALAYFFFVGRNPYNDGDTLRKKAKG